MRLMTAGRHRVMPWKNGGGSTTEIAVFPENAGLADFGWRVSMATVASDGPFSAFPGIDRTLSILSGEGLDLIVDDVPVRLTPQSPPHPFAADVPTRATLIGGTVVDLNVMTRRGAFGHRVSRLRAETVLAAVPAGTLRLLLARDVACSIEAAGSRFPLGHDDALLLEPGEAAVFRPEPGGTLYVIDLAPAA